MSRCYRLSRRSLKGQIRCRYF